MKTKLFLSFIAFIALFSNLTEGQTIKDSLQADTAQIANKDSILAVVYVSFYVTKKGEIEKVGIEKVENVNCNETKLENLKNEAVRIVSEMPKFDVPKKGKNVKIVLPMKFKLSDE